MPTYAVLGATGNCGTALIELLLRRPDANIHAFCRSKEKLLLQFPTIESHEQVTIFQSELNDDAKLKACITACSSVFIVLSTNVNLPKCSLSQDITAGLIRVLKELKSDGAVIPRLVLLSSSTMDENLSHEVPWLLLQILNYSASNVYHDLAEAEKMLRAEESWLTTIFIKPGALSVDEQRGHKLSLERADHRPLSYLDLAAAMIDAADDSENSYASKNVGVVNLDQGAKFPAGTPMCIATGLLRHFLPVLHPYLPTGGPK